METNEKSKKIKYYLFFSIVIVIALLLFLFLVREKNVKNSTNEKLNFGISGSINSLNPVKTFNPIIGLIYEPLITLKPPLNIVPLLARTWTNPSKLQWKFILKNNIYFHNGKPLTAKDVIYTIKIYKKYSNINLSSIKNVERFGTDTININTLYFDPDLLLKLSNVYIIPYNSLDNLISHPDGTGKYKFKKWKNLQEIELVKNEKYWEISKFNFNQIDVTIFSTPIDLINGLEEGKIDFCNISKVMNINIKKTDLIKKIDHPSFTNIYLGIHINENRYSYQDMMYLKYLLSINIDREKISKKFSDFLRPTFSPIYSMIFNYNGKFISKIPSNTKTFNIKFFKIYFEKNLENVATEIKNELQKLGYKIELSNLKNFKYNRSENYLVLFSYDFLKNGAYSFFLDTCLKKVKGNFIISGRYNFLNFEDSEMKNLISNFDKVKSYSKFIEKACKIFVDKYPYIPLFEKNELFILNKKKRNLL